MTFPPPPSRAIYLSVYFHTKGSRALKSKDGERTNGGVYKVRVVVLAVPPILHGHRQGYLIHMAKIYKLPCLGIEVAVDRRSSGTVYGRA